MTWVVQAATLQLNPAKCMDAAGQLAGGPGRHRGAWAAAAGAVEISSRCRLLQLVPCSGSAGRAGSGPTKGVIVGVSGVGLAAAAAVVGPGRE